MPLIIILNLKLHFYKKRRNLVSLNPRNHEQEDFIFHYWNGSFHTCLSTKGRRNLKNRLRRNTYVYRPRYCNYSLSSIGI